jgi:prepilin-type N-terminal cleavage/methylation domain-containing protein
VNRRGVTLIELMTVVAVMGLLASIAVPKYQQLRKRAQAADAIASMAAIRTGAFNYNGTLNAWPQSTAFGRVPAGLAAYLPGNLTFRAADYVFAWRAINVRFNGRRQRFQSVQVRSTDGIICQAVAGLLGGRTNTAVTSNCGQAGGTVVWLVDN